MESHLALDKGVPKRPAHSGFAHNATSNNTRQFTELCLEERSHYSDNDQAEEIESASTEDEGL